MISERPDRLANAEASLEGAEHRIAELEALAKESQATLQRLGLELARHDGRAREVRGRGSQPPQVGFVKLFRARSRLY